MSRWCLQKPFLCNVRALMKKQIQPRSTEGTHTGGLYVHLLVCPFAWNRVMAMGIIVFSFKPLLLIANAAVTRRLSCMVVWRAIVASTSLQSDC